MIQTTLDGALATFDRPEFDSLDFSTREELALYLVSGYMPRKNIKALLISSAIDGGFAASTTEEVVRLWIRQNLPNRAHGSYSKVLSWRGAKGW